MRYILDTNAWLRWFHQPEEISPATREILNANWITRICRRFLTKLMLSAAFLNLRQKFFKLS
jgi:PIN domain nuclease of toxin-antitoxin system